MLQIVSHASTKTHQVSTAVLTVEEAGRVLRIGRSAAYAAAKSGDLPVIKVGRCLRVPRHRLERMLGLNDNEPASNGLEVTTSAEDGRGDAGS